MAVNEPINILKVVLRKSKRGLGFFFTIKKDTFLSLHLETEPGPGADFSVPGGQVFTEV